MSDQGGGDRPRWEGFPGGFDPEGTDPLGDQPPVTPPPAGAGSGSEPRTYDPPTPPQFPVQPIEDEADATAPIPVVGAAPIDPDGLGPRRAARAAAAPRRDTSRIVAIACAIAVILVGSGFAFVACNNDEVEPSGNAPAVPITTPTSTTPSATPSASGSPSGSSSPSGTKSSSPSASATEKPTSTASATATAAAVKQPLVVLNSTAITGLAARVADDIEDGGWNVTETTNWKGAQPSVTTIYFKPGAKNKASAKLFAKKFAVAKAVKPALPGMTSNLTLVLTRDAS